MPETILYNQSQQIATITFNRPNAMNSFDNVMADELLDITEQVTRDDSIRAVHINGAGKLFMAGGDIQFFARSLDTMPAGVMKIVRTLNASILNIMTMRKPVLASVHGSVAGVGVSIMLACDLVLAAQDTKFTMAYSGLGISPDGGASFQLPRLVGVKKAMQWLLFSEIFDAQTALDAGLVNWVVPAEKLSAEAEKLLQKLIKGPTCSFAEIKRLVNVASQQSLEVHLEQEAHAFAKCSATQDFKSGVKAFLQKTQPEFMGE